MAIMIDPERMFGDTELPCPGVVLSAPGRGGRIRFAPFASGEPMSVVPRYDADDAPITPLRCLAILSAARDFGIARADIERVVSLDPFAMSPRELADALADTLDAAPGR
jgi:hypothetical protein